MERQVAEGRTPSAAAFVKEAVLRLLDSALSEEEDIAAIASAGSADIEAGRYQTIATQEDDENLRALLMVRLHRRLGTIE